MAVHVSLCLPSGDLLHAEFATSLAALCRMTSNKITLSIWNRRSSVLPESRNGLVRDALSVGATHLMWLDSDMIVPPHTVDRLLAHRAPIVGAAYRRRSPPHDVVARMSPDQAGVREGMTRMDWMGFGCVLTEASVFARIPEPWFDYDLRATPQIHEDRWFFRAAIAAGIDVLCDDFLTTQIGHIGSMTHRIEAAPAEAQARAA